MKKTYRNQFALFGIVLSGWLTASAISAALPSAAAAQHYAPPVQPSQRALAPHDHSHDVPFAAGSVLEWRNGQLACRPATEAEAQAMQHLPAQELQVLRDETPALEAPTQPQPGLKIVLRGTAQLEQHPEAKAAFLRAARVWEALIQNRITVVIDVDFGPTSFGKPFEKDRYGDTRFQRKIADNYYPALRTLLIRSAGSPEEAALYNALPPTELPTDLGATTSIIYHVAPLRALGVFSSVAEPEKENLGLPPGIAFNSATKFDFDPNDGIAPKHWDFQAAAMHEIGHALGFFSGVGINELNPQELPLPDMLDLFRFRPGVTAVTFATAPRILSSGGEHVFFGGGPELAFSTARYDGTGGDRQQSGHWKDDGLTGKYLGIMDPVFGWNRRFEMTANDRAAFELLGYRTNPLPTPGEAELKLDDGTMDKGIIRDGAMILNRLTPPSYPATLRKVRILMPPPPQGHPDPRGKPFTLWYGYASSEVHFDYLQTTVPSADSELFLEFTIPNGPTINSGDFYVGYQAQSPHEGVAFAVDLSSTAENRSFISIDNGASLTPLSEAYYGGKPANALIRAVISTPVPPPPPPTPTPTPPPNTVAIASGVPHDGYLARSDPYGVASETQYTIQVPSGATQLKIELTANTDLDLYANHGSRIVVQEGIPIADFEAVSDNHHESITITPESSPALTEGVYYLMTVNYGPGPSTFKLTATATGANPAPGKLANVSAASYKGDALASEAIASAFGEQLATTTQVTPPDRPLTTQLGGTQVKVKDSQGVERAALLFFVSPHQVNYQVPEYTALGTATVTVTSGDGAVSAGTVQIVPVAPGLFTANADGQGAPAAELWRFKPGGEFTVGPTAQYDATQRRFVPLPLDLGAATEQSFLILYGTGLRHHQGLSNVSAQIGGVTVPVHFAGKQPTFIGLDQLNVLLPRSLMGRDELDVALTVEGHAANTVRIRIK